MTLRILYVSHSFPPPGRPEENVGGMQRMATGLHDALARHSEVRLHSLLLETSWEATPYRMVPYMAGLLGRIPRMVRREGIDVVLFSSMVTAALAPVLRPAIAGSGARTAAVPVGRDVTLPTSPYQWYLPRVFAALDYGLPISRATAAECLVRGLSPEKMRVIPCGADVERWAAPEDRGAARATLLRALGPSAGSIPPGALLLCSVGRHQERKGFQWFVDRVMPRLSPDVFYLLGGEGPMTPAIRDAVARHRLKDRVLLLGRLSEEMLTTLYRGADLFVMPNVHVEGDIEGFGVVMLEAGLAGLPTVAADLEGVRDVICEERNGTLVPSGDADAFAAAVRRYAADRQALASASRDAARFTATTFGWPAVADRYVRVLHGVRGEVEQLSAVDNFNRRLREPG